MDKIKDILYKYRLLVIIVCVICIIGCIYAIYQTFFTDNDHYVTSVKNGDKEIPTGALSKSIIEIMNNRSEKIITTSLNLTDSFMLEKQSVIIPILSSGDLLGSVLVNADDIERYLEIAREVANFLSEYFSA